MRTLADMNSQPRTREWSGYTLVTTYAVGGHAGTTARTGVKIHLLRIETVIAVGPEASGRMKVGSVLYTEPTCYSAKHATVFANLDTDAVNCLKCTGGR